MFNFGADLYVTQTHKHQDLFDWIYQKPSEPEASLALKHKT